MTDNTEYFKMIRRMIRAGAKRAGNADEYDLADFAGIKTHVEEQLKIAVTSQRKQGKSWSDIGIALNMSKQAAFKRFQI